MVVLADDFNGGARSGLGPAWVSSGRFAVSADGYAFTAEPGNSVAHFATAPDTAAQFMEITFANEVGTSVGVVTRGGFTMPERMDRGYLARHNGSNIAILRATDNAFTQVGSVAHTRAAGQVLRLESDGDVHRVYVNGSVVLTVTDTTYPTGGVVGVRMGNNTDIRFDNARGGDLRAAAVAGAAVLGGSGSLTAGGNPGAQRIAALDGSGMLGAAVRAAVAVSAASTGDGSLQVAAATQGGSGATFGGAGSLTAAGAPAVPAVAALAGEGGLLTVVRLGVSGAAALDGDGDLRAVAASTAPGAASTSGSGTLSVTTRPAVAGAATFSGGGAIAASVAPQANAAATLGGSGSLSTDAAAIGAAAADLSGAGALAATGRASIVRLLTLDGAGMLAAAGRPAPTGVTALSGAGALAVTARGSAARSVILTGRGDLATLGRPRTATLVVLSGSGTLDAHRAGTLAVYWDGSTHRVGELVVLMPDGRLRTPTLERLVDATPST